MGIDRLDLPVISLLVAFESAVADLFTDGRRA